MEREGDGSAEAVRQGTEISMEDYKSRKAMPIILGNIRHLKGADAKSVPEGE